MQYFALVCWETSRGLQKFSVLRRVVVLPPVSFDTNLLSTYSWLKSTGLCQWRTGGFKPPPPPEIPKAHQNRAKLNPIVKNVKNC